MNAKETKQKWADVLKVESFGISQQEKNLVCANLKIHILTFSRYTSGSLEGRKLEFADLLLREIKKVRKAYKDAQKYFHTAALKNQKV